MILLRQAGTGTNTLNCPSSGWREIWPLPNVSSTSTTAPGSQCRVSPSLVSNSTHPVNHMTNWRTGVVCQSAIFSPAGPHPNRTGVAVSQADRWIGATPGNNSIGDERDIYILEMRLSICISIDTKAFHWSSPGFVPPNPPAPSPSPQALPPDYLCSV
jgi:hypothetical protein